MYSPQTLPFLDGCFFLHHLQVTSSRLSGSSQRKMESCSFLSPRTRMHKLVYASNLLLVPPHMSPPHMSQSKNCSELPMNISSTVCKEFHKQYRVNKTNTPSLMDCICISSHFFQITMLGKAINEHHHNLRWVATFPGIATYNGRVKKIARRPVIHTHYTNKHTRRYLE